VLDSMATPKGAQVRSKPNLRAEVFRELPRLTEGAERIRSECRRLTPIAIHSLCQRLAVCTANAVLPLDVLVAL